MKRALITLGILIGLGVLSSLAWVGVTRAADVRTGDAPDLGKNETVDGSLYIAGRSVTIDGTVKGDVFCAGQDVFVTGTVEGDVVCAGQAVRITGTVKGDVRVAGQQVDIGAAIDGSATVAGQSVAIKPDAKVGRDITLAGESVRLSGQVGRDVLGSARDVIVGAAIGRNVQLEAENVALESQAKIGGDLAYRSPNKARVAQGASIGGETKYQQAPPNAKYDSTATRLGSILFGFGSLLIIGLAAIVVAPRWFDVVGAAVRTRPVLAFALGAAVLLGTPVLAVLLMFTLIGLPLGLMIMFVWFAALLGAMAITAYSVGWLVIEKLAWPNRGVRIASLVVGLIILALLGLIPILGGIVTLVALVFGLGSLVIAIADRLRPAKKQIAKPAKA